jgi:hypothetical protein
MMSILSDFGGLIYTIVSFLLALAVIVLGVAVRLFIGLTWTPAEPFALFGGQ